jgi:hypothetical protein
MRGSHYHYAMEEGAPFKLRGEELAVLSGLVSGLSGAVGLTNANAVVGALDLVTADLVRLALLTSDLARFGLGADAVLGESGLSHVCHPLV